LGRSSGVVFFAGRGIKTGGSTGWPMAVALPGFRPLMVYLDKPCLQPHARARRKLTLLLILESEFFFLNFFARDARARMNKDSAAAAGAP
jgi:hypothetical protein